MSYEKLFEELGFKPLGQCSCRKAVGFMFQSPTDAKLQLWIYPFAKYVKRREWDTVTQMKNFTHDNMEEVIKSMI